MQIFGYVGLLALAIGWVPQTLQTIKEKDCKINTKFLVLNFIGSFSLMLYAIILNDLIFSVLNFMTTIGAIINIIYKFKASRIIA